MADGQTAQAVTAAGREAAYAAVAAHLAGDAAMAALWAAAIDEDPDKAWARYAATVTWRASRDGRRWQSMVGASATGLPPRHCPRITGTRSTGS